MKIEIGCAALIIALAPVSSVSGATVKGSIFQGLQAFTLTDGKTEAVIVPALSGRVMSYGAVGGRNWLWVAPSVAVPGGDGYMNYGGDKTFVGPHGLWSFFAPNGSKWPPLPSWDGPPFDAEVKGQELEVRGPAWAGMGMKISRTFGFATNGEFFVRQTIEKTTAGTLPASIWSVSQTAPPDAVWIPVRLDSPYNGGFKAFDVLPSNAQI